jgi:hypothetical protein
MSGRGTTCKTGATMAAAAGANAPDATPLRSITLEQFPQDIDLHDLRVGFPGRPQGAAQRHYYHMRKDGPSSSAMTYQKLIVIWENDDIDNGVYLEPNGPFFHVDVRNEWWEGDTQAVFKRHLASAGYLLFRQRLNRLPPGHYVVTVRRKSIEVEPHAHAEQGAMLAWQGSRAWQMDRLSGDAGPLARVFGFLARRGDDDGA